MKILTILGTGHVGNTKAIVDLFLAEFDDGLNEFDQLVLPKDMPEFCLGCANCVLKGEENCPHYPIIQPIISKIEEADFIILATPVFVMSCSGSMKALLDHLAYMWMVHRPKETMFHKVGLIVTTSGGAGVKSTTKLLRTNMFYWGIPKIYKYSITTMKMQGNYAEYEHKDEIKQAVRKKTKRIKRSLSNRKVGLKTKIFFNVFKMSQKKGWVPKDANYWKEKGWLDGKRPY